MPNTLISEDDELQKTFKKPINLAEYNNFLPDYGSGILSINESPMIN